MSENKNNNRRQFLRCGLTMAVAGLAATQAHAQAPAKATQDQAHYEDHADSSTCADCSLYQPPDQCKVVQGPVNEMGTCLYFTPASN
jgi:hypothetical protein